MTKSESLEALTKVARLHELTGKLLLQFYEVGYHIHSPEIISETIKRELPKIESLTDEIKVLALVT